MGPKQFTKSGNVMDNKTDNKEEGTFKGSFTGRVKHVKIGDSGKFAYGFIVPDGSTVSDVFVHYKDVEPWRKGFKELQKDDKVKFDVYETQRGLQARNVEVQRDARLLPESRVESLGNT